MAKEKLTPPEFTDWIEEVLQFGVAKGYGPHSWKKGVQFDKEANFGSLSRHTAKWYAGEKQDHESGLHPLKHTACRALMQVWYDMNSEVVDKMKKSFEE